MVADFTPITAFKDQFGVDFGVAYTWNRDHILAFLKNVSDDPEKYKAPKERKADFELLYKDIYSIRSPDGDMYKKYSPYQQLLRTTNAVQPTRPISWINGKAETFFIIFDLLGIFISLMGVPPTTQTLTETNYALPLVVLYGKWCRQLAQSVKFTPTVAQITWATSKDGKTFYPFLGTSAAGFGQKSEWKEIVRKARWTYLRAIMQSPYDEYGYSPERGPSGSPPEKMKQAGTNFGNCGETYPFLYILTDAGYLPYSYGIALTVASTKDAYKGEDYWVLGPMKPPCENCKQLLTWYKVPNQKHFELYPSS
ncbi:hypothetical protein J3R82DRAFT_1519 [Butyriboletus roseoflavus]|nr:hypothetical protein J3R82DRAFT_1519 [Butyriboletus roseoflavus]